LAQRIGALARTGGRISGMRVSATRRKIRRSGDNRASSALASLLIFVGIVFLFLSLHFRRRPVTGLFRLRAVNFLGFQTHLLSPFTFLSLFKSGNLCPWEIQHGKKAATRAGAALSKGERQAT
jgi:hypothetical protein